MPRRDDLEYKALHFIANTQSQGVLQADLWRKLGASSREGSRIALKLENKGLIRREKNSSREDGRIGCFQRGSPLRLILLLTVPV